ncbi:MAG: hypothetical protein WA269_12810 [Candidatus Udaeobacter sp.]
MEIRRSPCVSPIETKILRSKVELAFRLSFLVIPSKTDEWSSWENRDIHGKTELSARPVSESNLSMLVFLCRKITRSFKQFCIVGFTPDRILALHGRSSHRIDSSTAKRSGNIQA